MAPHTNDADGSRKATRDHLCFVSGGRPQRLASFAPHATLLDWLRIKQHATGTKEGCAEGDCGACTVVLRRRRDGVITYEPVNACILLLGQVDGAEVITVEDLSRNGELHPVQASMVDHHASQCGFCTPGIVMSLFALAHRGQPATREAVCDQLAGNLCRCTGYRPIVDAALALNAYPTDDDFTVSEASCASADPDEAGDLFVGGPERFFAAPASEYALARLRAEYPDALIVAGSTDAGLWITKNLQEPQRIIWLGRIASLATIEATDGVLRIGAAVTHARAMPYLAALSPELGEIMRRFGSAQVRASGTVGGNIANGSPIGDLAPCLIALGATLRLAGPDGARGIPIEDFFIGWRRQDLRPGEYVAAIEIPEPSPSQEFKAFKVSKRPDEDISAVLGAFRLTLENRTVTDARIAFGGMAATPARPRRAEACAIGLRLDEEATWRPALDALAQDFTPIDDMRASAAYRSLVARNLLLKALLELRGAPMTETRLFPAREVLHDA